MHDEKPIMDTPPPSPPDMPANTETPPLQFAVGAVPGGVIIQFSTSVYTVELYPHIAEELAKALKHHAKKARSLNHSRH